MSGYFLLESLIPEGESRLSPRNYPDIDGIDSWMSGAMFSVTPPAPIVLEWNPESEGPRKYLYDANIPLLQNDLHGALQWLGVDNLDCYPAEIVHPATGEVTRDYVAFNVIGSIKCANLGESKFADPSGQGRIDMDFDSLVLDEARTRGALMFRLAECVTGLVVHASIKQGLEKLGGYGLTFVPPEEWIG